MSSSYRAWGLAWLGLVVLILQVLLAARTRRHNLLIRPMP